jgi:hypothetical protein
MDDQIEKDEVGSLFGKHGRKRKYLLVSLQILKGRYLYKYVDFTGKCF